MQHPFEIVIHSHMLYFKRYFAAYVLLNSSSRVQDGYIMPIGAAWSVVCQVNCRQTSRRQTVWVAEGGRLRKSTQQQEQQQEKTTRMWTGRERERERENSSLAAEIKSGFITVGDRRTGSSSFISPSCIIGARSWKHGSGLGADADLNTSSPLGNCPRT